MFNRKTILVLACGAMIVLVSMGMRQAFGLFLQPISRDLGTGREAFSLAVALQNLIFGLPLVALLADRFGARIVAALGGLLYAASFILLATMNSPAGLYWNLGLLTGIALSGTSYVVVLGAAAQSVPAEKRGSAFGLITAAGSFGMFSMVPLVQWQISGWGWQTAFLISAGFVALIGLLAIGLPGRSSHQFNRNAVAAPDAMPFFAMLNRARCHSGYLLLITGFFVCGFHVAFISTHLPAYLSDKGVTAMAGAAALSMIGLFNIFGSYLFGFLGDRYRRKHLLSLLYLLRAAVIVLFLALPLSEISAIVFGGAIGFLWLATVPLTSGIVAQIFGSRYLSTFYGIVFFSHQIGSFLGVWLGGRLYDLSQSYTAVWLVAVALGLLAAVVHLPISDKRVEETAACKLMPVPGT